MPRILLVDDDELLVKTLAVILGRGGHTVLTAYDGEEGLATAVEERPDLILLDVMLPGMDGLQVCRMLRQDESTRDIPVIMFTALNEADLRSRSGLLGGSQSGDDLEGALLADDYLTKPVLVEELLRRVNTLLWISTVI